MNGLFCLFFDCNIVFVFHCSFLWKLKTCCFLTSFLVCILFFYVRQVQEQELTVQVTNEKATSRTLPKTFSASINKSQQEQVELDKESSLPISEPISTSQQVAQEVPRTDYPNLQYPNHYTVICTSDPREMNMHMVSLLR